MRYVSDLYGLAIRLTWIHPKKLKRHSALEPSREYPPILFLSQPRHARRGEVFLHVLTPAHPHQRCGDAGRRANELNRALGVGGKAAELFPDPIRQVRRQASLQEAGPSKDHEPLRARRVA